MAHPCFICGGDCYCHGDIDDVIVCVTPPNCAGCGCDYCDDDWREDDDDDDADDFCPSCGIGLNNSEKNVRFCQNCKAHW